MKGYMYILKCVDDSYYVGSTNNIELRLAQHQAGEGANHTKKRLPVELVYYEEYPRVDHAFYREKQVQGWRREKKEALINGEFAKLPELAKAYWTKKLLPSINSGSIEEKKNSGSVGKKNSDSNAPVAESITSLPPAAEFITPLPPVAESITLLPPVAESITSLPPVAESITLLPTVAESITLLPPVAEFIEATIIAALGNKELLALPKTAFLCSRKVPASVVLKCYDWAIEQREKENCVISGFHSQLEKDVLHYLLKGTQPIIITLARGLKKKIEPELIKPLEQGRILIISPFEKTIIRATERTAKIRNKMMIDLADSITVGYASKGGKLESLLQTTEKEIVKLV